MMVLAKKVVSSHWLVLESFNPYIVTNIHEQKDFKKIDVPLKLITNMRQWLINFSKFSAPTIAFLAF